MNKWSQTLKLMYNLDIFKRWVQTMQMAFKFSSLEGDLLRINS